MKIGILGAGPLGRALADLAQVAGHEVLVGYRRNAPRRLPSTGDAAEVGRFSDLILAAVPPVQLGAAAKAAGLGPAHRAIVCARGFEPKTSEWLSEIILRETSCLRVGALGGPVVAADLLAGRRGAGVIASPFAEVRRLGQEALHSPRYRVYPSPDLRGVELAGAMVQVIAVAVGMADGMGLGAGMRGVVFARGLAEAGRLAEALDADPRTFGGLVGAGDLVAGCSHPDHPAYGAGLDLARGKDVSTHDPVRTAGAALKLGDRLGVDLPLTRAIWAVTTQNVPIPHVLQQLMERSAPGSES